MGTGKNRPLRRYIVAVYIGLIALVLLILLAGIFRPTQPGSIMPQIVRLLVALVLIITATAMLLKIFEVLAVLKENNAKLEKIAETLEKNRAVMTQINQNTCLTESAKAVVFRDSDRLSLRETVFDKLHRQDFDSTYKIIEEISSRPEYSELAEQLRSQADKYRNATDVERANQVISHIERLFEDHQWAKASQEIESLIKACPDSEKAKQLRQKLLDKKQERKKVLLNAWDDAVKRQDTDRSLEILRELDLYLTPNEGLALQEAAKDVFRNKLHSLGVRFSLAISEKQWPKALQAGREIVRYFPNSKMAEEIREGMDALRQKAAQQNR